MAFPPVLSFFLFFLGLFFRRRRSHRRLFSPPFSPFLPFFPNFFPSPSRQIGGRADSVGKMRRGWRSPPSSPVSPFSLCRTFPPSFFFFPGGDRRSTARPGQIKGDSNSIRRRRFLPPPFLQALPSFFPPRSMRASSEACALTIDTEFWCISPFSPFPFFFFFGPPPLPFLCREVSGGRGKSQRMVTRKNKTFFFFPFLVPSCARFRA